MEAYLVTVAIFVGIYMLMTLGLNLHFGFTGMINFGQVAFFAIGAYASALLVMAGLPHAVGFLGAVVMAGLAAYPVGLMALRLRIEYLAIATLGFSEIVRVVVISEEWLTNGVRGLSGIPSLFGGFDLGYGGELAYLGVVILFNVAAILIMQRIVASPFGRILQAIRDDEEAVRALGKNPAGFKVRVFVIGAAFAGVAGALYAHYVTYIVPDQFVPLVTFYIWIAMIMGGAGRVVGAVAGTILLVAFLEGSRFLRDFLPGVAEVEMASLRLAVVGLALVLFILYRPQGMFGGYSK